MEKLSIKTEISKHSLEGVKKEGKTSYSIIPKIHIGTAKDTEDNEYDLSTSYNQDCLIVTKKGAKEEYLISFTQFINALEKAELI